MYSIVLFVEENNAPGVVASNWINEDKNLCLYPRVKTEFQKNKLVIARTEPGPGWEECPIKVLKEFDTYESAKGHLSDAELTSNLESETEESNFNLKKRTRKEKKTRLPGETSSEDEEENIRKKAKVKKITQFPTPPPSRHSLQSRHPPLSQAPSISIFSPPPLPQAPAHPSLAYCSSHPPSPLPPLSLPPSKFTHSLSSPSSDNSQSTSSSGSIRSTDLLQLKSNQELMWKVLGELGQRSERLEGKIDLILEILGSMQPGTLEQQRGASERRDVESPQVELIMSKLPLAKEEINILEEKLAEITFKQRLIKYLAGIGGKDVKGLAANLMRRLFLDELGEMYSLTGKGGKDGVMKRAFVKTQSFQLIYDICLRKFRHSEESQIREAVSDWLTQSKFRKLRRESRKNKREERPTEDPVNNDDEIV